MDDKESVMSIMLGSVCLKRFITGVLSIFNKYLVILLLEQMAFPRQILGFTLGFILDFKVAFLTSFGLDLGSV